MSKTTENIMILNDIFEFREKRLKALSNLASLGTPDAIDAIGARARDLHEEPEIRNMALYYLRRRGGA